MPTDAPAIPADALVLYRGLLDCGPDLGREIKLDAWYSPVLDDSGHVQYETVSWAICYELEQEPPTEVRAGDPLPEPGVAVGLLAGLVLVAVLRRGR